MEDKKFTAAMESIVSSIEKTGLEPYSQLYGYLTTGKEEYITNKIFAGAVEGRIKKQIKEICLLEQAFVRSDLFDGTVAGYVADVAKKTGSEIKVASFIRLEKGEGLEKKVDDFAAEVAKMAGN